MLSRLILALLLGVAFTQLHFPSLALGQIFTSISTIEKGQYSGVREAVQIVIRDQDQWVAVWTRHSSKRTNPPPPPNIDFSVEMVVGIFLGEKTTGGYAVEITKAVRDGSSLRVYYREKSPAQDAIIIQVLTQPYHLVRLPRYQDSPLFLREDP